MNKVILMADQLIAASRSLYCVIDGALVDDIKSAIEKEGLEGRPLFHDNSQSGLYLAGPWLVPLNSRQETQRCFAVAHHHNCGVAWSAPCDAEEISRHLRTLNMARLPDEGLVYFRHYDPDVLASVCPLLDENQAARVLGPAECVGFLHGRGEGSTVQRPPNLPHPPPGPLTFHEWQAEELEERQRELSRRKICEFLGHVLPRETRTLSDQQLIDNIARHERSANKLGLDTERSITQWIHLSLLSDGASTQEPAVRATILKDGRTEANKNFDDHFFGMFKHYVERRSRR